MIKGADNLNMALQIVDLHANGGPTYVETIIHYLADELKAKRLESIDLIPFLLLVLSDLDMECKKDLNKMRDGITNASGLKD